MKELIRRIVVLKNELRQQFNAEKLITLYRLIDELEATQNENTEIVFGTPFVSD